MVRLNGDTHRPHQRNTNPFRQRNDRRRGGPSVPPDALKKTTIVEKISKQAQISTAKVERVRFFAPAASGKEVGSKNAPNKVQAE